MYGEESERRTKVRVNNGKPHMQTPQQVGHANRLDQYLDIDTFTDLPLFVTVLTFTVFIWSLAPYPP